MAKDFTKYQQGIVNRYYEHRDTIRSEKLSELVAELWLCEDEKQLAKLWGRAQVALMRAGCNAQQVANVVNKRDVEGLAKLVQRFDAQGSEASGASKVEPPPAAPAGSPGPPEHKGQPLPDGTPLIARGARSLADGRTIEQMMREKASAGGYDSLEEDNLKRALKAFRQKLKTLRRDDESRLSGRYVTKGQASAIVAITPPKEFPASVWEELVRQGRLKRSGQGTYQLP